MLTYSSGMIQYHRDGCAVSSALPNVSKVELGKILDKIAKTHTVPDFYFEGRGYGSAFWVTETDVGMMTDSRGGSTHVTLERTEQLEAELIQCLQAWYNELPEPAPPVPKMTAVPWNFQIDGCDVFKITDRGFLMKSLDLGSYQVCGKDVDGKCVPLSDEDRALVRDLGLTLA